MYLTSEVAVHYASLMKHDCALWMLIFAALVHTVFKEETTPKTWLRMVHSRTQFSRNNRRGNDTGNEQFFILLS